MKNAREIIGALTQAKIQLAAAMAFLDDETPPVFMFTGAAAAYFLRQSVIDIDAVRTTVEEQAKRGESKKEGA